VLDAARDAGLHLAYGCRTGTCGVCRARLLKGTIDYGGYAPPGTVPLGLTAEEIAGGQVLLCQARPQGDLELEVREVEGVAGLVIKTLPARIERIERLAHDVMGLWLKLPKVERLQFLAGQYLDILLSDGRRRSFSLANAPRADALLELHVRLVPGGAFSTEVFERLQPKALLRVQAPLGSFFLREDSTRPILMIAGGTGFAPLKGMLEHMIEMSAPPFGGAEAATRPVHLYWGVRSVRDLYLADLPARWAREHAWFRWTPVLSEPDADWRGRRGWVHDALLFDCAEGGAAGAPLAAHDVYMAGPPPMCRAARAAFASAGLPDAQLYYDSFEFSSTT
jgi:CDP-4-dehydro-6-deoxyglucose reductase